MRPLRTKTIMNQDGIQSMADQYQTGFLGILMLDTSFPRILGDAGNANSYTFPTKISAVSGADSLDVVRDGKPKAELVAAFCDAAVELEKQGAKAIISTCGFLISIQDEIQEKIAIPVMVSSLSLYHFVYETLKIKNVGILTASSRDLGHLALKAANIKRADVEILGFEDCEAFTSAILQSKDNQPNHIDAAAIEQAAVEKSKQMISRRPDLGAFLLECGNLPPYTKAIANATKRPVFSILDAAEMLMQNRSIET